MCIRDSHSTVVLTYDTRVMFNSFHPLKTAATGATETFGLIENLESRPNSPAVSLNSSPFLVFTFGIFYFMKPKPQKP